MRHRLFFFSNSKLVYLYLFILIFSPGVKTSNRSILFHESHFQFRRLFLHIPFSFSSSSSGRSGFSLNLFSSASKSLLYFLNFWRRDPSDFELNFDMFFLWRTKSRLRSIGYFTSSKLMRKACDQKSVRAIHPHTWQKSCMSPPPSTKRTCPLGLPTLRWWSPPSPPGSANRSAAFVHSPPWRRRGGLYCTP